MAVQQVQNEAAIADQPSQVIIGRNIGRQGLAILNVGNPGNAGGGRPKSEVTAAARKAFDERIPLLCKFADDPDLEPNERLKAIDMLGKYGAMLQVDLNVQLESNLEQLDDDQLLAIVRGEKPLPRPQEPILDAEYEEVGDLQDS